MGILYRKYSGDRDKCQYYEPMILRKLNHQRSLRDAGGIDFISYGPTWLPDGTWYRFYSQKEKGGADVDFLEVFSPFKKEGGVKGIDVDIYSIYFVGEATITDPFQGQSFRIEKRNSIDLSKIWITNVGGIGDPTFAQYKVAFCLTRQGSTLYAGGYMDDQYGNDTAIIVKLDDADGSIIAGPIFIDTWPSAGFNNLSYIYEICSDENGLYLLHAKPGQLTASSYIEKRDFDITTVQWSTLLSDYFSYPAHDMTIDESYIYFCYGAYNTETGAFDWKVLKMDKSDGSIIWSKTITFNANYIAQPSSIKVDTTGVYIGGSASGDDPTRTIWYIEKRDLSDGNIIWSDTLTDTDSFEVTLLYKICLSDTSVYAIGYYDYAIHGNPNMRIEKRNKITGAIDNYYSFNGLYQTFFCNFTTVLLTGSQSYITNPFSPGYTNKPVFISMDSNLSGILNTVMEEVDGYTDISLWNSYLYKKKINVNEV